MFELVRDGDGWKARRITQNVTRNEGDGTSSPRASAPPRLFALLLENVLEGCANETLAAAVATHQAEAPEGLASSHPELREMFRRIAEDERSHAALAFAIHAWGRELVDAGARAALDAAYERAVGGMTAFEPSTIGHSVGEPSPECARLAFLHIAADLHRSASAFAA